MTELILLPNDYFSCAGNETVVHVFMNACLTFVVWRAIANTIRQGSGTFLGLRAILAFESVAVGPAAH